MSAPNDLPDGLAGLGARGLAERLAPLEARIAELEEAARWRVTATEPPPPTLSTVYGLWWPSLPSVLTIRDGVWVEGSYVVRPPTHWRPLGPGPEVSSV